MSRRVKGLVVERMSSKALYTQLVDDLDTLYQKRGSMSELEWRRYQDVYLEAKVVVAELHLRGEQLHLPW